MPIEDMRNNQTLLKNKVLERLNVEACWDITEEQEKLLEQSLIDNAVAIKEMNCDRVKSILASPRFEDLIFNIEQIKSRNVSDFNNAYYVACEVAYCRDVEVGINVLAKHGQSKLSKHLHTLATDLLILDFINCED
ncbi:hypothetical protein AB6D66_00275 [Vibrio pomeroyi]|uniref:Uncharacterized protein n=1 Tax=Vibrio pomeroyi TaxID=198832 RepID=A0ABV4MQR3_9VIBR|nr:hypothetical protein [Vibrio atlanticus]MCZ4310983.1 hypothetical protein [Vibrio atlanticus]